MADQGLARTCQALTRKGLPCGQPTLPDYPYCFQHIKSRDTAIKTHDRYSTTMPSALHSHYQHQLGDDKPKDLIEEISYLRSMVRGHFEKMQNRSLDDGSEQVTMADMGVIMQLTEHIGRAVERQAKVNPERVITVPDAMVIITKIIDAITEEIPHEQVEVRNKIVGRIQRAVQELVSGSTEMEYGQQR